MRRHACAVHVQLYPNVCVLTSADVGAPAAFAKSLAGAPHYLHVPSEPDWVRQVCVCVTEPCCVRVPHVCSEKLRQHAKAMARSKGGVEEEAAPQ